MSMHPRKPIKKPPAAQVQVDLREAYTIKCEVLKPHILLSSKRGN